VLAQGVEQGDGQVHDDLVEKVEEPTVAVPPARRN
jgi:hypothetical protein